MKRLFLIAFFMFFLFNNNPINAEIPSLYTVREGDVISIKVYEHPEFDAVVNIAADGTIKIPFVGVVYVKDKNILEIEKLIARKLSQGYIKNPVVSVSLISSQKMEISVFVYGSVFREGKVPYEKDMTLINAIFLTGGIKPEASFGKIEVKRKQKKIGYQDVLETYVKRGEIEESVSGFTLQPEDIIIVKSNEKFYIIGDVAHPGAMYIEGNITLEKALLFAGVKDDAGVVRVKRRQNNVNDGEYKEILKTYLKDGLIKDYVVAKTLLQPEDIVIVERRKTFYIKGDIGGAGKMELETDTTLEKALLIAGIPKEAYNGKAVLKRKKEGGPEYIDIIEADLRNGIIEDRNVATILLQPEDVIIIERSETYIIYGEVNKPGEYEYEKDLTLFKAIVRAGGFTKWGSPKKIKILKPIEDESGYDTIDVDLSSFVEGKVEDRNSNIKIEPDDIIIVKAGIF